MDLLIPDTDAVSVASGSKASTTMSKKEARAAAALDHPMLAAFRRVGDAVPWQDFPVSRHWEFEPAGNAEAGKTVTAFVHAQSLNSPLVPHLDATPTALRPTCEVRLEDAVESEEIFSTLMGEDVESRRKFIEENALDVKNLDV